jgi:serine/threonine protein kinase
VSDDTAGFAVHGQPGRTQATGSMRAAVSGWVLGNRYRVLERIGSGGAADVFRAHDELLERDVALKVFRASSAQPDTTAGQHRQQTELHALARLNHPNLITLFDGSVAGTDEPAYLVMELIDGPNLAAKLGDGRLPEPQIRELGIQVADALSYVHAQAMVHRDVKPANILLGTDTGAGAGELIMRARLSDFGIVRLVGTERMTGTQFALGTAAYLAPEQARGDVVGPLADVYSLGLVLLEALTGVRPYDGPVLDSVAARVLHSPDVPDNLPRPWPELLAAMTSVSASRRPTAAQVAQALRSTRVPTTIASVVPRAVASSAIEATRSVAAGVAGLPPPRLDTHPRQRGWQPERSPAWRRHGGLYAAAILVAAIVALAATMVFRPATHAQPFDQRRVTTPLLTATSAPGGAQPVAPAGIVTARAHPSSSPARLNPITAAGKPSAPAADPPPTATTNATPTSASPVLSSPASSPSSTIGSPTISGAGATPPVRSTPPT